MKQYTLEITAANEVHHKSINLYQAPTVVRLPLTLTEEEAALVAETLMRAWVYSDLSGVNRSADTEGPYEGFENGVKVLTVKVVEAR